ncbi:hypothetical protein QR721_11655 [Aciduricibacillus chroicocephali]|uniref:DUF4064 domain-containing protein n=1 Tax=Aciduricibacillus chroicocephali TaxID=3054939 RepID=A0ABY9KTY4_9BACI|nr:hypothetical protein QR721_11655 [Bacillaceae bacterium 44XB]
MGRSAKLASKLSKIAGILYIVFGGMILLISMFTPIEVTLNDYTTRGRLWELAAEPGAFIFLLIVLLLPIAFGIIGLYISKKVRVHPSTFQGVFMIVVGFFTVIFLVGILFIVAGIQTLLAKKEKELLAE